MYNLFEGIISFVQGFYQTLPQPILMMYSAFLATFIVIATFQIIWRLR